MDTLEQTATLNKVCVYQAIANGYDKKPSPIPPNKHVDYEVRAASVRPENASLWNRFHKIMNPPMLHERTLYMDGNIGISSGVNVANFTETWLKDDSHIAICAHAARKCAYVEIEACVGRGKITHAQADIAHKKLKEIGLPKNFGLWECGIIARRRYEDSNHTLCTMMKHWWELTANYVCRDQIWLPAVIYMMRNELPAHFLRTLEFDVRKNDVFTFRPHK